MKIDDWNEAKKIFGEAIKVSPQNRARFLDELCRQDNEMRREVESLLVSFDNAEDFMEQPAAAEVAALIEIESQKIEKGTTFGHYEIIQQIGSGGMGEVYLAQDKKLPRQVAIKILNEEFGRDQTNLNRFIREAKAASSLNHPNILVIHEIGAEGNANFIVSEFIEGKTLRELIKEALLQLPEILEIAIQVGNALTAAHAARIVHRDIKPENVMIRPDGYVKILDFGLAKLVETKNKVLIGFEDENASQSQTAKGVILGMINYMSPEQARGEPVDEQTGIFSFGAVVYEMIAGKAPFAGASLSETLANLIYRDPPPLTLFQTMRQKN